MQRDWTRDEDYADIPLLDDGGLAWEFLRRNSEYAADYAAGAPVDRWGLGAPADPRVAASEACPFWRWDFAPSTVVRLAASPLGGREGGLSAGDLCAAAVDAGAVGADLGLRFANGLQAILSPEVADEDCVAALIPLDGDFLARATAARLLRSGVVRGWRPVSALSAPRRRRLALTLRALDGREARASYRQISWRLLRGTPDGSLEWRTSSMRALVIRLCVAGRAMVAGGYRGLLRGRARLGA